jgi:DNA sulfur modification protein DndB
MKEETFQFIEVEQTNRIPQRKLLITKLPAGILTNISYAAIRGKSDEEGAVQRILNVKRIKGIKEFTLNGGDYPGAIILNWVAEDNPLNKQNNNIVFFNKPGSAQIIDGQHRLAGIKSAIKEKDSISNLELPVVIYEGLNTQECADIFLSINTEQKIVPRSLVYDLYGVGSKSFIDRASERARDIACYLNENPESPYYEQIKFPGERRRKGGIALSTVVTAIKPLAEGRGAFEQISIFELEIQKRIIFNFLTVLKDKYEKTWNLSSNVFQYSAGFAAAMEFLQLKVIPQCNLKNSFTVDTIKDFISLDENTLIYQEEVKGMGGKEAQKTIYEKLLKAFEIEKQNPREIEI